MTTVRLSVTMTQYTPPPLRSRSKKPIVEPVIVQMTNVVMTPSIAASMLRQMADELDPFVMTAVAAEASFAPVDEPVDIPVQDGS